MTIQVANRTLTTTKKNYFACECEALAVVFVLKKFRLHLLSTQPFLFLTDQQALRTAFSKKESYWRLTKWTDFLAEYKFEFVYKRGVSNKAADFLLRVTHGKQGLENKEEKDLMLVVISEQDDASHLRDLESPLRNVASCPAGNPIDSKSSAEQAGIRRRFMKHLLWKVKLYRRQGGWLCCLSRLGKALCGPYMTSWVIGINRWGKFLWRTDFGGQESWRTSRRQQNVFTLAKRWRSQHHTWHRFTFRKVTCLMISLWTLQVRYKYAPGKSNTSWCVSRISWAGLPSKQPWLPRPKRPRRSPKKR